MHYPIKALTQLRPLLLGFRKQAGLSQANVAKLLGITQQSYAKIEANPSLTSVERLYTILRLLGGEILLVKYDNADPGQLTTHVTGGEPNNSAMDVAPVSSRKSKPAAPPAVRPPTDKPENW